MHAILDAGTLRLLQQLLCNEPELVEELLTDIDLGMAWTKVGSTAVHISARCSTDVSWARGAAHGSDLGMAYHT
jgi:hypothetical protein